MTKELIKETAELNFKNENTMIPQLIVISIGMINLGMEISKHGKQETKKYNWWASLLATLIYWTILYYGGFWTILAK